jgi:hypothetical protein
MMMTTTFALDSFSSSSPLAQNYKMNDGGRQTMLSFLLDSFYDANISFLRFSSIE